jgi:hypothetical protein
VPRLWHRGVVGREWGTEWHEGGRTALRRRESRLGMWSGNAPAPGQQVVGLQHLARLSQVVQQGCLVARVLRATLVHEHVQDEGHLALQLADVVPARHKKKPRASMHDSNSCHARACGCSVQHNDKVSITGSTLRLGKRSGATHTHASMRSPTRLPLWRWAQCESAARQRGHCQ